MGKSKEIFMKLRERDNIEDKTVLLVVEYEQHKIAQQ